MVSVLKAVGLALACYAVTVVLILVITLVGVGSSSHMGAARAGKLLVTLVSVQAALLAASALVLGFALRAVGLPPGGIVLSVVLYVILALATLFVLAFVTTVALNR